MAWLVLVAAGLMEVGWAVGLKYTQGFTRLWPSLWTIVAMALSLGLLGTVLIGIWLLGESADPLRLGCIALILAGILGLKLTAH
jgi:quaternary ammonium compound-resistance protein SugE